MEIIDKLVALISIDFDKQKLDSTKKSLEDIKTSFIGIKTAVLAASIAAFEFERRMTQNITTLGQTSRLLNISAKDLQVLEYASKKSGISFDAIGGSIQKLNGQLADISIGKVNADFVALLGKLSQASHIKINPFDQNKHLKTGYQLFNEIGAALQHVNKEQQLAFSNALFGANILPFFAKSKAAREELSANNLILTDKDIAKMEQLNQQFVLLGQSVSVLLERIAIKLEPLMSILLKVTGYLNEKLKDGIKMPTAKDIGLSQPAADTLKDFYEKNIKTGNLFSETVKKELTSPTFFYKTLTNQNTDSSTTNSSNTSNHSQSNVTNHNDNKTINTTTINNIKPSNLQSIFYSGTVR